MVARPEMFRCCPQPGRRAIEEVAADEAGPRSTLGNERRPARNFKQSDGLGAATKLRPLHQPNPLRRRS